MVHLGLVCSYKYDMTREKYVYKHPNRSQDSEDPYRGLPQPSRTLPWPASFSTIIVDKMDF